MIESGRLVSERVALSAVARVTPLTYQSIPGLELQAVVVGLRLVETITGFIHLDPDGQFFRPTRKPYSNGSTRRLVA